MKFKPIKSSKKSISYLDCWAKFDKDSFQSLSVLQHSINVGACCAVIVEHLPKYLQELIPQGMNILTAAHDVGKIAPCFQVKSKAWAEKHGLDRTDESIHHSVISEYTLRKIGVTEQLCEVIGFHHGWREYDDSLPTSGSDWQDKREIFLKVLEEKIGEKLPKQKSDTVQQKKPYTLPQKYFLSGLVVLSDWLGSSKEFYPLDWKGGFDEAKLRARDALKEIKFFQKECLSSFDFEAVFKFKPNNLQKQFLNFFSQHLSNQGSTFILQAPMGVGKTETAFASAAIANVNRESRGIFFGLPTMLTSNQIYFRMEEFLTRIYKNPPSARRLHSKAFLYETRLNQNEKPSQESALHAVEWFGRSMKKAILADYGVGTIDQALLGVLPVKHFFLRLFALAGKTVIFDEVHSYDAYTGGLLKELLKMLSELRCNVIVMSATLTAGAIKKLFGVESPNQNYPAAHFVHSNLKEMNSISLEATKGNSVEISLKTINNDTQKELVVQMIEHASMYQANILWVCNSVANAQEIYRLLKSQSYEGGPEIGLLHSRYLPVDRKNIEDRWMSILGKNSTRSTAGSILVGTQVVEQSLDIDADHLITELAPIDFILQRCGRLWRHNNKNRPYKYPTMMIAINEDADVIMNLKEAKSIRKSLGVSSKIYCPYTLLRTLQVLLKYKRFDLPFSIQDLIEDVYRDSQTDNQGWQELLAERNKKEQKLSRLSSVMTMIESLNCQEDEDDQIKSTRYQEYETMSILAVDKMEGTKFRIDNDIIDPRERITAHQQIVLTSREIPIPSYRIENSVKTRIGFRDYFVIETEGCAAWKRELPADNLIIKYTADCGLTFEKLEEIDEPCE